ncbi:MAG: helix-turn-helix domain-containing protein [Ruminococcaceae bacterium]|nr:helix-turn-helix domain-containing protein [Oscillospiraceae bacterium]
MSVEIIKSGKWQSPSNTNLNPKMHIHEDYYQLIFTQNSVGKLVLDDARYPFKPEHLYFTPPGVCHTCANKRTTQYVIFYFKVLTPKLAETINSLPPELAPYDLMSCKQMLSQAAYEFSTGTEFGRLRANAYFELFLSAALDGSAMSLSVSKQDKSAIGEFDENGIDRVANYIYNNFSSEISVDNLVEISNFERRQFYRVFKEKFGTTPNKYINELRINKAKALLTSTNMPMSEIATYCGFNTEHYFSRAFKLHEKISPNEYRKNAEKISKEIVF